MKRWLLSMLICALIVTGGCSIMTKTPDTAAFKDDFTKEFMDSPEEVKDGYYLFRSKTDGYTMLYPKNAKMDDRFYEKHEGYYERLNYGESNHSNNISYFVRMTYENKKTTDSDHVNLGILSEFLHYKDKYSKVKHNGNTIYYAKTKSQVNNKKNGTYYIFFSYINSNKTHQGIEFIYSVTCLKEDKKCSIDLNQQEERAKTLMKSIKFIS